MHDTIRVNASPNRDLHCSTCRGMLKGRVILMPYPQSTCYWTLRPFVLFQLLPVDQARTRQWHLHLGLQRCHSQVRNACSICTTFLFQYLFWNTGTLTLVLLTFALFSFRFIAERGEGGQLIHVEKIDEAFHLKPLAGAGTENVKSVPSSDPERPLSLLSGKPRYNVFHVLKHFL